MYKRRLSIYCTRCGSEVSGVGSSFDIARENAVAEAKQYGWETDFLGLCPGCLDLRDSQLKWKCATCGWKMTEEESRGYKKCPTGIHAKQHILI